MGFGDVKTRKSGFGRVSSGFGGSSPKPLATTEGLSETANQAGLGQQANSIINPSSTLSPLQRLGAGLGSLNPAQAVLTGINKGSIGAGLNEYAKDVIKGVGSAITGKNLQPERATFSDVAHKLGIHNDILANGIGFVADVLLDPSTYFGGAIAKVIGSGARGATELALKGVGKIVPKAEEGLRLAGQGIQEAAGKAFQYGYGTSSGLPEKALEIQSKLAKSKEGIVASNIARLGTGTLSPSQQQELVQKLLAGKRAEFTAGKGTAEGVTAAQQASQGASPEVQKVIGEQTARSQKFAQQAGIKDPYEIYFPGLKNDSIKRFLDGTKSLKVGSQGYLKEFKNLLTDEQLIKNPAEAFAKREVDIARDNIIKNELNGIVKSYGKPLNFFKSEQEALRAGYKVVKEKGVFGKEIGYLKEVDKKFLDNLITPEFTSIDMLAKATGYDALTSLFKRSVTGLFPSFHVRNYVSGHIQNFETLGIDALNPKNIAIGQKVAYKLAIGDKSIFEGKLGRAFKKFEDRFGSSSRYISDIQDATAGAGNIPGKILGKESFKTTLKTGGIGQQAIPFRVARAVGNFIETQQKATAYVTALSQGKTIKEALNLAATAGFDYRALTGFESKILRRLIPFYSFTRKNIELQLKTLGENPQRINQVMKAVSSLGQKPTPEEKENLPDYMQQGFTVKTGISKSGLPEYTAGFGTPIEQFSGLFGKDFISKNLSTLNNIIRIPLERAVGKDFFRNKPLNDVFDAKNYKNMPNFVKDFLQIKEVKTKDKDGNEVIKYNANPKRLQLLNALPSSRLVSYFATVFNKDLSTNTRTLYALTGVKPTAVDLEITAYFRQKDQRRALEDLLVRSGVIKQFTSNYVPKKKKKGFGQ